MENVLGKRITMFRERLEMSQEEVAKATGLDVALLRAIEAEEVYPALGVLIKLARALGQRLGTFMDDQFREDPRIIRAAERTQEVAHHPGEIPGPYRYFPLGRGKTDRHMDPFFVEIDPHQEQQLSSHEGEEFIIVVSGAIELFYGKQRFILQPGDSMYYNSIVPHFVSAVGDETATVYAVMFMPF